MTLWIVAHHALLSMEFSRQEYWNGLPCPPPGDPPDPGIEPTSLKSLALAGRFFTIRTWEAQTYIVLYVNYISIKLEEKKKILQLLCCTYTPMTCFLTGSWLSGRESTCQCKRRWFNLWAGRMHQKRKWQPTAAFLLAELPDRFAQTRGQEHLLLPS